MKLEVKQRQDEQLLREHAKSSYNFTFIGRYEWLLATVFLIVGGVTFFGFESIKLAGLIPMGIGILELVKYPNRIKRWTEKKKKEKIFNKEIRFSLLDDGIKVIFDKTDKSHLYSSMRECLISNTGILFKISYSEYYYISFRTLDSKSTIKNVIDFLNSKFHKQKIKIRNTQHKKQAKG